MSYLETRSLGLFSREPNLNTEFFRYALLEFNRGRIGRKLLPQVWAELTLQERHEVLMCSQELEQHEN